MPDDIKDYWMIQVNSVEGFFLLDKLISKTKIREQKESERALVLAITPDNQTIFMLKRSLVEASLIASILGATEEAVKSSTTIIKVLMEQPPGLKKPTVNGWGTA